MIGRPVAVFRRWLEDKLETRPLQSDLVDLTHVHPPVPAIPKARTGVQRSTELGDSMVVEIDNRSRGLIKARKQLAFCPGNSLDTSEPLEVRRRNAGNKRMGRAGDFRQARDLARCIHPHLEHGHTMFGCHPHRGQRQTDEIVEITRRRQHCIFAVMVGEDRTQEFLGRGLAVGSGNRDHRDLETPTMRSGDVSQRPERIIDLDERDAASIERPAA
mmetsp:Transcript_11782/g.16683  ORF Transcript_11782/g.16683 Transcript_11782/m.16683 type:complete len:216 (-) Transcript_11782:276-923(-)